MSHTEPQPTRVNLHLSEEQLQTAREQIVAFIADQVTTAGADGAVIGLSGGVDSTLTAFLAVEALDSERVQALIMPGDASNHSNMRDAERVANLLEIPYEVIEITSIVETILDGYPKVKDDTFTVGNTRARVRAVLSYLVANHEDMIVLGTGNRAEILTGYFTKYGDGAVDCLPIGTLYNQQVRQIARDVGVPDDIVEKTPTAELWAGQTDKQELGMDYDTLDAILALHIEGPNPAVLSFRGVKPADTILTFETDTPLPPGKTADLVGIADEDVAKISRLCRATEHKRSMPPVPEILYGG